jgi:hypothetical protein
LFCWQKRWYEKRSAVPGESDFELVEQIDDVGFGRQGNGGRRLEDVPQIFQSHQSVSRERVDLTNGHHVRKHIYKREKLISLAYLNNFLSLLNRKYNARLSE